MKKVINLLLPLVMAAGVINSAEAQRRGNREVEARDQRSPNVSQARNERVDRSAVAQPGNNRVYNSNSLDRSIANRHADGRANAINSNRIISTNQQRNQVALLEDRRRPNAQPLTQQRVYRANDRSSERYVNRTVYNNYNNNYYYRGGYRHVFMSGPRYRVIPRSFITLNFGGYPYYYNDGFFYGSYGGYYEPMFPPPGISIRVLPFGYRRIFIGANLFYYFNGIYYRNRDKETYEVVDAPMGATVSSLPKGAKSVVLNGEKLYELNGTYYKEDRNYKGETVYTVVGKNGEINNSDVTENKPAPAPSLNTGTLITELPEGSKVVTINGEKLYVTPDNTYLKEEANGNVVEYKVVGK